MSVNAAARPARPVPAAAWWIGVAIVLVAANLRPAVVGVAPMLSQIQAEERLSATAAGILTALPVLCFGLIAPLAPPLARRIGIERALLTALGLLIVGFLVRSSGPLAALYAGTVLLGSAIAIGNVLLPSLIKRDFAHRTGMMTGLYTMAIAGGGALAAGVTMPVAQAAGLGWNGALAIWALFALVALLCWLPHVRRAGRPARLSSQRVGGLWRDAIAWQVTIYMGLQSLGYFAVTAWLPAMLVERGYDPVVAGWLLSLSTVAGIAGATMAPVLAMRGRRQRGLAFGITTVAAVGLVGVVAPLGVEPVAVILLGAAQSAALGLALTLVAVRAPDAMHAAQLSGMSQSVGYVLAAAGPFAVGALRDVTGGWTVPLLLLIALLAVQGTAGMLAGRDKQVRRRPV
ncbi:CP family cyanate transporter-like MFS transporter [Pseudonocardia hierapolitana]|uniref:CP family cyanate transporter-like MFS transporter n=1 Tax=Pseudonocardia hierapolitana TaxID=1128676 RepID=A0A561T303_9PSEU|nr:MFS transporter [Pseudonocardia hierapolitana]TWF81482.1 CP family cyanate transporter-like MFS transporter [Pseudonocardia hierapolitana]